ncbi:hypothetical protein AcV7_006110 [Taiwanofungus camphoratus]|nr:hypothetical protein AcV7_006110 [Antrodia cinnamomea]
MHGPTPQSTDSIATAAVYVHLGPPSPLHSRLPGPSQHAPAKAAASRVAPEGAFIARAAVSGGPVLPHCRWSVCLGESRAAEPRSKHAERSEPVASPRVLFFFGVLAPQPSFPTSLVRTFLVNNPQLADSRLSSRHPSAPLS